MTTSCTDTEHPFYGQISKLNTENVIKFFTGKNSHRLRFVSLGEALDFMSFGGMNFVVWPNLSKRGMAEFIQTWMKAQEPRIKYKRVPIEGTTSSYHIKEKSRRHGYLWNRFHDENKEQLPFKNYEQCPSDKGHKRTVKDLTGRLRCAHVDFQKFRPSFVEIYTSFGEPVTLKRLIFQEEPPQEPFFDEDDYDEKGELFPEKQKEEEEYQIEKQKFDEEEPSLLVHDPCYSVISDKGIYLPLENVLWRLDISHSFLGMDQSCAYPFSGFTLANYVKAWHNQKGRKIFFMRNGEREDFRIFQHFSPVSSDD